MISLGDDRAQSGSHAEKFGLHTFCREQSG